MLIRYHLFITTNIKNELGIIMGWKADGMVSGAVHSTGDTVRPALQIVKTKPNVP